MIFAAIAAVVLLFGFVAFTGAPYVPSRRRDLQKAFDELYRLKKTDVLVDIGSGDGIVLREASRRGARAIGYELQPLLVLISRDGRDIAKMVQYLQHETNRLGHDIWLLSYGFEATGLTLHKTAGAHNLYLLQPQS